MNDQSPGRHASWGRLPHVGEPEYDLLDENVHFLPGWFADTPPTAPVKKLAILCLDADLYSSTLDILNPLYDRARWFHHYR
ncbi:hypothetical protein CCP3SC15_2140001 [Gammaproteobacteria bacterium]